MLLSVAFTRTARTKSIVDAEIPEHTRIGVLGTLRNINYHIIAPYRVGLNNRRLIRLRCCRRCRCCRGLRCCSGCLRGIYHGFNWRRLLNDCGRSHGHDNNNSHKAKDNERAYPHVGGNERIGRNTRVAGCTALSTESICFVVSFAAGFTCPRFVYRLWI